MKTDRKLTRKTLFTVKMASIYIVFESTQDSHMIYPTAYKSLADACAAIKARWMPSLEEFADTNGGTADEIWFEAVSTATVEGNATVIYIEKGNTFEIHQMTV